MWCGGTLVLTVVVLYVYLENPLWNHYPRQAIVSKARSSISVLGCVNGQRIDTVIMELEYIDKDLHISAFESSLYSRCIFVQSIVRAQLKRKKMDACFKF